MSGPVNPAHPRLPLHVTDVDAFDLPEWLGTHEIVWRADATTSTDHVPGMLADAGGAPLELPCDLLAADHAHPAPVLADPDRTAVHRQWHLRQVHLGEIGGRLTLMLPTNEVTAELVVQALTRLSRAVGGEPVRWLVQLRLGDDTRRGSGR